MQIKNNNLSWRYEELFALAGALKGLGGGAPTNHKLSNQARANIDINYFI